jgi:hypothetical protein
MPQHTAAQEVSTWAASAAPPIGMLPGMMAGSAE